MEKTLSGYRVNIWKQDPLVSEVGTSTIYLHTPVQMGPYDDQIKIVGVPAVGPTNEEGDYLFDPKKDPTLFDTMHTYAVVRRVLTSVERAIKRMGGVKPFRWQWGEGPLLVYPYGLKEANAYYARHLKSLKFGVFKHPVVQTPVVVCRSYDVVAHELGHAILDAMKPGYWVSDSPETGGLHESFGDLLAMFSILSHLDMCDFIITESKCDLHNTSFFAIIAEELGQGIYRNRIGLRNADNNLTLSDVGEEVHAISQVFTGAVYDTLSDIFEHQKDLARYDPAETLFRVGQHMASLVFAGILMSPPTQASYRDIAAGMIEVEPDKKIQDIIRNRMDERHIFGYPLRRGVAEPKADFSGSCETMRRKDDSCTH